MINCGITGSTGVLGNYILNNLKFNFIIFNGDITKKKDIKNWIKENKFDFIIHLAAIVPTQNVDNDYSYAKKVNFNGTKNLVDALVENKKKIKNIFFASTSHVYKIQNREVRIRENHKLEPYSKYGKTKLLAENYIKKILKRNKIKYCIGRIFSFTDPKQANSYVVPGLFNRIKKDKKKIIKFEELNHYRDFLSIKDISNAIKILCLKNKGGVYNIGSSKKLNLEKIASFFCKKFKKKALFVKNLRGFSYLISNNQKLCSIGWRPKVNIIDDLKEFK